MKQFKCYSLNRQTGKHRHTDGWTDSQAQPKTLPTRIRGL